MMRLAVRFFLLGLFFLPVVGHAQLTGIMQMDKALDNMGGGRAKMALKLHHFKLPKGGHLQGIALQNNQHIIITGSSATHSYYLTGNLAEGNVTRTVKLLDAPLRHAGGCQMADNKLAVGIEDNISKSCSQIMLLTFNDSLQEIKRQVIANRSGAYKRSTAGAVGITRLKTGQYLIAAGDWDSKNIDFYLSRQAADSIFDSLTTLRAPVNMPWGAYQGINLICDTAGQMHLLGFCKDRKGSRMDLFRLNINSGSLVVTFLLSRYFNTGGAGFRYAAGLLTAGPNLYIWAAPRRLGKHGYVIKFY